MMRRVMLLLPLLLMPVALLAGPDWTVSLPWLLNGGVWGVDALRYAFLLLTFVLWSVAGVFAVGYLKGPNSLRYCLFWVLTFAGNAGLVVAQDIASFYSFFALMTFAGYGLVVHEGSAEARKAGRVYMAMAIIGEMAILAGLMLAANAAASHLLDDLPAAIASAEHRGVIIALLLAGFGVKAGLPLLHFWLPLAHPVAPTPASAVLSGAMIKAGLLGWLVTLPLGEVLLPGWANALVVFGALGSLGGALLGVVQRRAKTVLAYSSISQMGLMLLLLAAAMGSAGQAMAIVPVLGLYALHHGLAKGCLFLSTAMIPPANARGRFLRWLLILLPGLSLAGLPFTSGAVAKLAMKDVLKPDYHDFMMADALPILMSAGAVATLLLVWRFVWVLAISDGNKTVNRWQWWGWSAACLASLSAFFWLPLVPAGEVGSDIGNAMQGQLWTLSWPLLIATGMAGVAWLVSRRREAGA